MKEAGEGHETLGEDVIPYHYRLRFDTDFKTFRFKGDAEIFAMSNPGIAAIRLNSKELKIIKAEVESAGRVQQALVSEDKGMERITLSLKSPVSGICRIRISFEGVNNDKMYGFYRSVYRNGGKTEYMLTSQFESTDARSAFPCFDEPAMKATFSVSIIAGKEYMAVSNMPIERESVTGNRKETLFHTTPKMSTYLLYLGVGKFDYVESSRDGVKYRVLTVPGKKRYARLALGFAGNFVAYYGKYFGIRYMLPKLDMIAVPDFAAGAMENWGAITFREIAVLGTGKSAVSIKEWIAETVAHELTHQWFGDLVTMKWWNDLWLNESFADYMSNKAVDAVFPKWKFALQYLDTVSSALSEDELKSTHPISVAVRKPSEIEEIFDSISYAKGGSVLRMMEDFVGDETFRKGLNRYLNKHLYGNAAKDDLWSSISEEARREGKEIDLKRVADAWTGREGYPAIGVAEEGDSFIIRQERCLLVGEEGKGSAPMPVPLHYLYSNGRAGFLLFETKEARIPKRGAEWIKLNYGQRGVYRATYSERILSGIGRAIRSGALGSIDAWGVESDLFDLARKGKIRAQEYLAFVSDYCMDCVYPANIGVSSHLSWLYVMLFGSGAAEAVRKAILEFNGNWLARLGWEGRTTDSNTDIMMRSASIQNLGLAGESGAVGRAVRLFRNPKAIEPDIRGAVYGINASVGDAKTYNRLLGMYKKAKEPEENRRLLASLGRFGDRKLAEKALAFSQSKDVRLQDSIFIPAAVAGNPAAKSAYWPWAKRNWKKLMEEYDGVPRMLSRLVDYMAWCGTREEADSISRFFRIKSNVTGDIIRSIAKTGERIEANIKFMERNS